MGMKQKKIQNGQLKKTAATHLVPNPFGPWTSGPPLPVPMDKCSPKIRSPWTNGPQNIWSLVLDKQLTNSLHSVKFNSAKSDFVLSEAQLPKVECVTVQKIAVRSQEEQNMSWSKGSQAEESKSKISKVKVAKVQTASAPKQTVKSKMQSKKSGPKRPWH